MADDLKKLLGEPDIKPTAQDDLTSLLGEPDLKKKDVVVPVQDVIPKAVSASQSSKGGESVSAPLDEAQTAQVDQPTDMQQQLKEKGLIVDEPTGDSPYTPEDLNWFKTVQSNPRALNTSDSTQGQKYRDMTQYMRTKREQTEKPVSSLGDVKTQREATSSFVKENTNRAKVEAFRGMFPNEVSEEQNDITSLIDIQGKIAMAEAAGNHVYDKYKYAAPDMESQAAVDILTSLEDATNKVQEAKKKGVLRNVGIGTVEGVKDYFNDYLTLSSTIRNNKSVTALKDKLVRINQGTKEELTKGEASLLQALQTAEIAAKAIDKEMPEALRLGEGLGGSIGFMLEFGLTGGAATMTKKAIVKGAVQLGAKSTLAKAGVGVISALAKAGVQTGIMPSFYKEVAKKVSNGESSVSAIGNSFYEIGAEVLSERMWMSKTPSGESAKNLATRLAHRVGSAVGDEKGIKGLAVGFAKEFVEEKTAEALKGAKDIAQDKQTFDEFAAQFIDVKSNLRTAATVAVMTGVLGGSQEAIRAYAGMGLNSDIKMTGSKLPADVRSAVDDITANRDLTQKEVFDLVAQSVKGSDVENKKELLVQAANYATTKLAREAYDEVVRAKTSKVKDGEVVSEIEEPSLEMDEDQKKVDYLLKAEVPVPDGTTMEQLDVLYNETKAKEQELAPPPSDKIIDENGKMVDYKPQNTISFYHGGLNSDFDINSLDVTRPAQKQQKKGRNYAGFYMYDESQKSGAQTYSDQTGKALHRFDIDANANILTLGNIERLTQEQILQYKEQGYDLIKGTDVRGRTEYVLLNKDVVRNVVNEKQEPVVVESTKVKDKPIEAQNKPVEPLTVPEAAQAPPVKEEGLNQQKENIEQRRKEDLASVGEVIRKDTKSGTSYVDGFQNRNSDVYGKTKQEVVDKINAKYDSELAALETNKKQQKEVVVAPTKFKQEEFDAEGVSDLKSAKIGGVKYEFGRMPLDSSEKNVFYIADESGAEIGRATLAPEGNFLTNIRIDEKQRRKGLGTALYDYVEQNIGKSLIPSPHKLSPSAKQFWEKRNQQQQQQPIVGEQQIEVTQLKEEQNGKENGQGRQGLQIEEAPIKEAAKRVADSLRKAKFIQSIDDLSKLSSDPTAILKVAWDGSVEVAAKAIEAGGSVAQAVADGINTLKASEWYKKLSDESKKIAETRFQSDIENHFKEQENAKGTGSTTEKTGGKKEVVKGEEERLRVRSDAKNGVEAGEGKVKERQQGKKIIASTTLPEDIKQQFEDEGIDYIPRGEKVRREDARQIADAKLQMEGGREQLKSDIMDTTNEIKGDTRVVLARSYVEDSLLKSAQAETATERRKYRDEATEMLHFLMIRSTDIAQELQANKEISEMLAADPEMIEDVYRKEIAKKNAEFYSANKEPIKSAKQIIDDYLNSKEFKEKYKPKPDLTDNGKTSPRERRERGIAKIADAMSKIASLTGAKKNFVEEDFQRGSSLRDAISELASGILDVGVASTEELITKIKINTRKFLTSSEVDKIAKDVIDETDAANRITPKKTRKVKLDKEDEAKLVARLYGKMTDATEGQLRRLIADNIELFEREGSINDAAFKELFAKALGKDYVSDDVIDQLKKSAQIIFDVKVIEDDIKRLFENALKLQNEGAAQSAIKDIQKQIDARLKDHRLAVHEAEKANKYISESFSDPKTILTILGSNIQGNLVTTQSQLVNIIGNYSMMPIRAPKNFVAWMMDAAIANTIGNLKKPILDAINKKQAAYVSKEAQRLNIPESEVVIPTYFHKYRRFADKLADKELKRTGVGLSKYQFIGQARGFKEGIRQLWTGQLPSDIYKRDMMVALHPLNAMFDNYNMLTGKEKMEFKKFATNSVEALLSAPPEVMFRFLNLFDKPVRRGAELDKLNELANLKGLEGIEKKKFIEMPDEESAEEARIAGDKATFQQDTKLSKASSSLDVTLLKKAKESTNLMSKVSLYLAYFVKKGTVPFVKTPINVTMEMLDYALPHVSFAKGIFAMFAGDRKSFTENMGKAMVGAMINQGIGYLFATGIMSLASGGNEDEDKELISKKVKAAEYRDKPANYINTSALQRLINNQMYGTNESLDWRPGDNMSSYRRFGILSGIAMAHGEAYKGKTKEEIKEMTGLDMARLSFMPVVKSAAEQSFVTGTSALVNALIGSEYERDQYLVSLSKAAGATALPNSLRTYIQANDNYIRETKDKTLKGVDKFKSTLKADFKSSFTSDSGIPTKVTIWGEPVRRYEDGSSPAFQLFDITRSKVYRGDFGAKIFELYEKTKEEDIPEGLSRSDILPPVLGEKFNYEEKEITLDPKTYEDYQIYVGTMLKKDVEAKVNSMEWEKMDTKEKIISLRKSWASSKKSARSLAIEFWKEQNIEKLNELLVKQQGVKIKKENMKKAVNKPKSSASDILSKAR